MLPLPHSSDVHMNKFRLWIEADSTTVKAESNIAQFRCGYPGNTDVNSLSLHVQAVSRHPGRSLSQKLIAPGAAIPANDVDFRFWSSYRIGEVMEQIE